MGTRLEASRDSAAADWEGALEKWARPSPLGEEAGQLALLTLRGAGGGC